MTAIGRHSITRSISHSLSLPPLSVRPGPTRPDLDDGLTSTTPSTGPARAGPTRSQARLGLIPDAPSTAHQGCCPHRRHHSHHLTPSHSPVWPRDALSARLAAHARSTRSILHSSTAHVVDSRTPPALGGSPRLPVQPPTHRAFALSIMATSARSLVRASNTQRGRSSTRPDGVQVIFEVTGDASSTPAPGRCTVHQCPCAIPPGEGRAQ